MVTILPEIVGGVEAHERGDEDIPHQSYLQQRTQRSHVGIILRIQEFLIKTPVNPRDRTVPDQEFQDVESYHGNGQTLVIGGELARGFCWE